MKEFKIEVPNGYEIDESKSTFSNIVFKKVEEIDFSILNDTDWFYVEAGEGYYQYLCKGYFFKFNNNKCHIYNLTENCLLSKYSYLDEKLLKKLRKCTPEEIEIIKSKFPELFEKEYPKSVEDIPTRNWYIDDIGRVDEYQSDYINQVSTKQRAEALLELSQLLEIKDAYNKIDDCVIDWSDSNQIKYYIELIKNSLNKSYCFFGHRLFTFGKESTRDLFFDRFKDKIEFVLKNL